MSLPEIIYFHYTMMDSKGFELCKSKEPLSFIIGKNQVFTPIEKASYGMRVGDTKRVAVPAIDAFGLYDPSLKDGKEDNNHLLAGVDLLFEIIITTRRSALEAEL